MTAANKLTLALWPLCGKSQWFDQRTHAWQPVPVRMFDSQTASGICARKFLRSDGINVTWRAVWVALFRLDEAVYLLIDNQLISLSSDVTTSVSSVFPFVRQFRVFSESRGLLTNISYLAFFPSARGEDFIATDFFEFAAETLSDQSKLRHFYPAR